MDRLELVWRDYVPSAVIAFSVRGRLKVKVAMPSETSTLRLLMALSLLANEEDGRHDSKRARFSVRLGYQVARRHVDHTLIGFWALIGRKGYKTTGQAHTRATTTV